MSIADFDKDADARLEKLSEALRTNKYKPLPVRRTYIPKLGSSEKRPLGIPTIIDRIVQTAVRNVIEPIFEHEFDPCSYGFRHAHYRWPNVYFTEHGLFSLVSAVKLVRQS